MPPRDFSIFRIFFPLFLLSPLVHLEWRRQRKHQTSVDALCFDRGSSVFLPEDTPRTAISAELGERVQDHAEICSLVFLFGSGLSGEMFQRERERERAVASPIVASTRSRDVGGFSTIARADAAHTMSIPVVGV